MSVQMYVIARDDDADAADAQNIEKALRRMRAKRLTEPLEHIAGAKARIAPVCRQAGNGATGRSFTA